MGTWKYIGVLAVFIVGVSGYAYAQSEVMTVVVTDKYIEDVPMRRGRTGQRYVLVTNEGDLPILKFPVLGYTSGVEDVYAGLVPGTSVKVRVAKWPPEILGDRGKSHILAVY